MSRHSKSHTMTFSFDELPLVIESGFEAGFVAGSAEISYHRDGEWTIQSISLDGCKRLHHTVEDLWVAAQTMKFLPAFERKPVALDEGTSLFLTIYHRLEHEWNGAVNDAVLEQIAEDRECEADDYADMKRDEMMLEARA